MRNLWELPNNMQQQNTRAAQTMANPQTYWKTGRKNKVVSANHSLMTLTQKDFDEGDSPLQVFTGNAGVKIRISDNGVQADGNLSVGVIDAIEQRFKDLGPEMTKAESSGVTSEEHTAKSSVKDITLEQIRFLPNTYGHLKGKTAREIADALSSEAQKNEIVQFCSRVLPGKEQYAAANQRRAKAIDYAWELRRSKTVYLANGQTVYDMISNGEVYDNRNDQAFGYYAGLLGKAQQDPEFAILFQNAAAAESEDEDGKTYQLYFTAKTPDGMMHNPGDMVKYYSIKITCTPSRQPYPIRIAITNAQGKLNDRKVGLVPNTQVNIKNVNFDLSREEFARFLHATQALISSLEFSFLVQAGGLDLAQFYRSCLGQRLGHNVMFQ